MVDLLSVMFKCFVPLSTNIIPVFAWRNDILCDSPFSGQYSNQEASKYGASVLYITGRRSIRQPVPGRDSSRKHFPYNDRRGAEVALKVKYNTILSYLRNSYSSMNI
jgi:hypothetical protein